MSGLAEIQKRIWERREAELAPSWAAKYARENEVEEVKTEGALPAAFDMPEETAAQYKELARLYNAEREASYDPTLAAIEADEHAAAVEKEQTVCEEVHSLRESTYIRHVKNRTGEVISADAFEKARAGRAQLEEDTIDIAMKLESVGTAAFGSGPKSWLVDPSTGETKALVNVRNRCFLPTAAAKKRAPMVASLELLLRRADHKHDIFCTFTGGKRVPLIVANDGVEVREGLQAMARKISKLNAEPFMKSAGASILFRSAELGGLEEDYNKETGKAVDVVKTIDGGKRLVVRERGRNGKEYAAARYSIGTRQHKDTAGNWLFHLHTHTLLHLERFLDGKDGRPSMAQLTEQIWDFWQDHWSIDGALEKIREACKYVVKPAELKLLSAVELAALDVALFRLHRTQPLGELKEQIKYRRDFTLTVKRERRAVRYGREVRYELRPVVLADWNARKKNRIETDEQKERRKLSAARCDLKKEAAARAQAEAQADQNAADTLRGIWGDKICGKAQKDGETLLPGAVISQSKAVSRPAPHAARTRPPVAWKSRVVARLSPAPYFGRIASPALLVWSDERPDLAALVGKWQDGKWEGGHSFVRDIVAAAEPLLRRARAGLASEASKPGPHVNERSHQSRNCPDETPHLPAFLRPQTWQPAEITA